MNSQSALSFVLGHDIFLAWAAYLAAAIVAYLLLLWPLRAVRPLWLQFLLRGVAAAVLFTPALVQVSELRLLVPAWFTALYGVLQKADDVVQTSLMALVAGVAVGLLLGAVQAWITHRKDEREDQQRRAAAAVRHTRDSRAAPAASA
ncbi:MAG: hypothetical protein CME36_08835 [unclassified Hahellaceae]|nr:hypothetical protein [Hahellaceae bacterium]|tara:strand:+ start:397 stop:837 length:441 start_codon:yes stop_codon:yes gene_type:complete